MRTDLEPGKGWTKAYCLGCEDSRCIFKPMEVSRRPLGEKDIRFEMKYCGVCHSDLHIAAGHMDGLIPLEYEVIPGHELAGVVTEVGRGVSKFKRGDHIGVGCMIDSCLECKFCKAGEEQKCAKQVQTYQGKDWSGRVPTIDGKLSAGGYSSQMVVHERFGIKIPQEYPLEYAGPIFCASITVYDPMKKFGVKKKTKVGICGLGGLGGMAVKIAKAMGATVTAISRTPAKRSFALEKLGADDFLAISDPVALAAKKNYFDLIINTIPQNHKTQTYTKLCHRKGKHVLLGLHSSAIAAMMLAKLSFGSTKLAFSAIGGIRNTQEVMDLCAQNKIYPEIDLRPVSDLNRIFEALDASNDSGKRYILDIANTLNASTFDSLSLGQPTKLREHLDADSSGVIDKKKAAAPSANQVTFGRIAKELLCLSFSFSTWF